jgi:outer membrane protein OmpA-like peptidoglycan-associated protein
MSSETMDHSEVPNARLNWLSLVLGSVLVLGLIIFIFKGCKGSNDSYDSEIVASDTVANETANMAPANLQHESLKVKLPDGTELDAYKNGIEDQLVSFLNNPASIPGKDVWFDFDNLNFKTGSADITEDSKIQLQNIAAILKAYPKVKIKIGGYTDKTGDSLTNLKLSQSRADAVEASLKTSGVGALQLVGAEGYGSQYATVSASASDEERKKDRRIAVSVRAK